MWVATRIPQTPHGGVGRSLQSAVEPHHCSMCRMTDVDAAVVVATIMNDVRPTAVSRTVSLMVVSLMVSACGVCMFS